MRKIFIICGMILFTNVAHAITCNVGEYLNDGICTPIDVGFYGVGCTGLPNEYTELEYLESTGSQSIDTAYLATNTTEIYIKYEYTVAPNQENGIFGNKYIDDNTSITGTVQWNGSFLVNHSLINPGGWNVIGPRSPHVIYTDYMRYGKYISNGIEYSIKTSESRPDLTGKPNTTPIFLFQSRWPQYKPSARIYYARIVDNCAYVRNMIPARRISDNKIGMYDTINNKFYTNAANGTFIAGPEIICSSQAPCPTGFYCENGIRRLCPIGTYNDQNGKETCKPCTNAPSYAHYVTDGWTTPTCPWVCNENYIQTAINTCNTFCMAGATKLRTDTGVNVPLFSSRNTTPSINIKINGNVCYADLISDTSANAINIRHNDKAYHTKRQDSFQCIQRDLFGL